MAVFIEAFIIGYAILLLIDKLSAAFGNKAIRQSK